MGKGFFRTHDPRINAPVTVTGCASCGLASNCLHPKMEPTGQGKKGILFVAMIPGKTEDEKGTQLIGKVGQRLRRTLRLFDVDLDHDCRKTNSLRCFAPEEEIKSWKTSEMNARIDICRGHILDEIRRFAPRVIIPLGNQAVYSILGTRWRHDNDFSIGRWRNLAIPDHDFGAWICPTFHPSYVERSEKDNPAIAVLWEKDLANAIEMADVRLPRRFNPDMRYIWKETELEKYFLELWKEGQKRKSPFGGLLPGTNSWIDHWKAHPEEQKKMAAYTQRCKAEGPEATPLTLAEDIEATNLKPYGPNQRIKSCALAESPNKVTGFMWPTDRRLLALFRTIMETQDVLKIAANCAFEHNWFRAKCGFEVQGWLWDTMTTGHVLDNRKLNSNVKFQAFTRLGVLDYDSHIKPYLRAGSSNGINRIDEIPEKELLEYNSYDSACEFGIYLSQKEETTELSNG